MKKETMKRQAKEMGTKVTSFSLPKTVNDIIEDLSKAAGVTRSLLLTILLSGFLPLSTAGSLLNKILIKKGKKDEETFINTIKALAEFYGFSLVSAGMVYHPEKRWRLEFMDPKENINFVVYLKDSNFKLVRLLITKNGQKLAELREDGLLSGGEIPFKIIRFISKVL